MPMLADTVDGVIGVDTHRDTLAAAVLSPVGGILAQTATSADATGYQALLDFALQHTGGPRLLWAVEGTRSYGIELTRFLHRHAQLVSRSTTMAIGAQLVNRPSDPTGERPVGDALGLQAR